MLWRGSGWRAGGLCRGRLRRGRSGRPRVVVAGAVGEVADRVAELLADGPAEGDGLVLAGLAGRWGGSGQADQRLGFGELRPAVADLGEQPGGADGARAGQ